MFILSLHENKMTASKSSIIVRGERFQGLLLLIFTIVCTLIKCRRHDARDSCVACTLLYLEGGEM